MIYCDQPFGAMFSRQEPEDKTRKVGKVLQCRVYWPRNISQPEHVVFLEALVDLGVKMNVLNGKDL